MFHYAQKEWFVLKLNTIQKLQIFLYMLSPNTSLVCRFHLDSWRYSKEYKLGYLWKSYTLTFNHGIFLDVSSVSLLSLGLSGGWSSLRIPGDSSPLTSPPPPCSDVSLRSDSELTFRFDCTESVRLTEMGMSRQNFCNKQHPTMNGEFNISKTGSVDTVRFAEVFFGTVSSHTL